MASINSASAPSNQTETIQLLLLKIIFVEFGFDSPCFAVTMCCCAVLLLCFFQGKHVRIQSTSGNASTSVQNF